MLLMAKSTSASRRCPKQLPLQPGHGTATVSLSRPDGSEAHPRKPAVEARRSGGRVQHVGTLARIQEVAFPRTAFDPAKNLSDVVVWYPHRAGGVDSLHPENLSSRRPHPRNYPVAGCHRWSS